VGWGVMEGSGGGLGLRRTWAVCVWVVQCAHGSAKHWLSHLVPCSSEYSVKPGSSSGMPGSSGGQSGKRVFRLPPIEAFTAGADGTVVTEGQDVDTVEDLVTEDGDEPINSFHVTAKPRASVDARGCVCFGEGAGRGGGAGWMRDGGSGFVMAGAGSGWFL
jgi:hypothetical protein